MDASTVNKIAAASTRPKSRAVFRIALILTVYLIIFVSAAWLTQTYESIPGVVAWYPPDGVSFALLLTFGAPFILVVALASFISSFLIYQIQLSPLALITWSIYLPLTFGSAAALLRHGIRFDPKLRNVSDVVWLTLLSALISAFLAIVAVSAEIKAGFLPISEQLIATYKWWIGEMIGIIAITPMILIHVTPRVKNYAVGQFDLSRKLKSFRRPGIKFIGQALSIPIVLFIVFKVQNLQSINLLYFIALPLLWIALDRGLSGISIGIPAISFGITFIMWGLNFDPGDRDELQLFMLVIFITTLLIGVVTTERTGAEKALTDNEKRFRALIENNADAITLLDANGITLYDSAAAPGMLGFSPGELIGTSAFDLMHPAELAQTVDLFKRLTQSPGNRETTVIRLKRKDGAWLWIEVIATNLLDEPSVGAIVVNYRDITVRKQAEEKLAEERNLLRILIDLLPDRIFVKDTQGHKTLSNIADWQASGGKTMEDVIGKTDFDTYPRALADGYWAFDSAILASGIPLINREENGLDINGNVVSVLTTKVPLRDENGKIAGLVGVGRDISERKLAEKTLHESEEKYRLLFENNPLPMWVDDLETLAFLSVNDAAVNRYGYSREEFLKMTIKDIRPPEEVSVLLEHLTNAPSALGRSGPWKHRRKDGSILEVEIHSQGILFDGRRARMVLANDITERLQAEQVLANERNLLRTLIDNLPDYIFIKDVNSRIVMDNNAHQQMLGANSPEQVLGKTDFDFFPKEIAASFNSDEKHIIQSGESLIDREEPGIDNEGNQRWLLTTKVPIRDHDGKITGIVGINHDITEGKHREEKIRRQLARLTALSDIDRAITSSFGLDISLGTVLTHVTEQLSVDAAAILIFNPATNTLSFKAGRGFRTKAFENSKVLRMGEGYAGRAILERRTLHISNLSEEIDNVRIKKALPGENFVSYYCVPLIAKGNIKGAMEIFNRSLLEPDEEWLDFAQTLASQAALAIDNASLFDGVQRSNIELTLAYDATIEGWSRALDMRDKETEGHTQRVTDIALSLAQLFGLNDRELVQMRRGALLHDMGKLGVPDGILLKPGPLTNEEWIIMKKHPQFAFDMLAPIQYLKSALDIPYCHHEKWDGTGYPRGLKGEQIPLTARIFAVVDIWDALSSDRPYRSAWPAKKVIEHLRSLSGTQFDPEVVKVCLDSGLLNLPN